MMNPAYIQVIASSDAERLDLFLSAAGRLGTAVENVEKDFWVCWTLDALFNGRQDAHPRLLFKLRVLAEHRPPVFVMENVKGLLSATVSKQGLFGGMLEDLQAPRKALGLSEEHPALRYELHSVVPEVVGGKTEQLKNYLVESERHGVPQARHRLILLGLRSDVAKTPGRLPVSDCVSVSQWLSDLPPIRSGLSDRADSATAWIEYVRSAQDRRWCRSATSDNQRLRAKLDETIGEIAQPLHDRGARYIPWQRSSLAPEWVRDVALAGVCNHESRSHMAKDLHRYLFASAFASVESRSPVLSDFPTDLLPEHANVTRGVEENVFADRFRVQLAGHPASTITSHIAKDGHYFIHHDSAQCRSLTVSRYTVFARQAKASETCGRSRYWELRTLFAEKRPHPRATAAGRGRH